MELDFSRLANISQRKTTADTPTPTAAKAAPAQPTKAAPAQTKRSTAPLISVDGRNYNDYLNAVFKLLKLNPVPGNVTDNGGAYFEQVCNMMIALGAQYGEDTFLKALLCATYDEIERQFLIKNNSAGE